MKIGWYKNSVIWSILIILEFLFIMLIAYIVSLKTGGNGLSISGLMGQSDSLFYYNQIVQNFEFNTRINSTQTYFVPIMTFLAIIFNTTSVFFLKMLNVLVIIPVIVIINKIIQVQNDLEIEDKYEVFSRVLLKISVFPSIILAVSIPFGRDVWIYLLFMLTTLFGVRIVNSSGIKIFNLGLFLISVFFLYHFRSYAGVSVGLGFFLFMLIHNMNKKQIKLLILLSIVLFIAWFVFLGDYNLPLLNMSLKEAISFQSGQKFSETGYYLGQRSGESDFMGGFNTNNIFIFLLQLLETYAGNIIGPFPWQWTNPEMFLIGLVEAVPMFWILTVIWIDRKKFIRYVVGSPFQKYILIQSFMWWSMLAISNKNIGTGMRLKVPLFLLVWISYYSYLTYKKGIEK